MEKNKPCRTARRPGQTIPEAVEELLAKMTTAEKFGQMYQSIGADITTVGTTQVKEPVEELLRAGQIGSMMQVGEPHDLAKRIRHFQDIAVNESRLGIPLLFCLDVIHGFETIFPIPLAWSCCFDEELIRQAAATSAREAACCGINYIFSPMVDIPHDPRWGRVAETAGEDPWWGSRVSAALVKGMQEDGGVMACLKHYLGYAAAEAGRDYNTVEFSDSALHNTYLPPFAAGVKAGVKSVMTAFNVVNGVPAVANRPLVEGVLRGELGFDGVVVSDYAAVMELMEHGVAEDEADAAEKALAATLDIEMTTNYFRRHGEALLNSGRITMEQVDAAVRRILTAKYELGVMDDPYRFLREEEIDSTVYTPEHLAQSRTLAARSAVLLKNDGVLPLAKDKKLALIGPFADSSDLFGCWCCSTRKAEVATLATGLREKGFDFTVEEGSGVQQPIEGGIERAVAAAKAADVAVLALGEDDQMSGEACSRMNITIPECQKALAEAVAATGKPTVLVLTNGRPLLLNWYDEHMNAILEGWAPGSEGGRALADLLAGDEVPGGKLTMSFPWHTGQIPVYYNELPTGRPFVEGTDEHFQSKYLDGPNAPLYPFGCGLTYGRCVCGPVKMSGENLAPGETLTATVTVRNEGSLPARETVQLYLRDRCASLSRPVQELRGVKQVWLEPGQQAEVSFAIDEPMLRFYTARGVWASEAGGFDVMIGLDSRSAKQNKAGFTLTAGVQE